MKPGKDLSLTIDGDFGAALDADSGNLVLRAATALQAWARKAGQPVGGAALHLEKTLPLASGIGGGSADAAAALHTLGTLWGLAVPTSDLEALALGLGADVPVCLDSRPRMMRGIGEVLEDAPTLPPVWVVLANPMREVPTGKVFAALDPAPRPMPPQIPGGFETAAALADWLRSETVNDLEAPARQLAPEIGTVLDALSACPGVHLARMSGSGATCFALFDDPAGAGAAATALRADHPRWWVEAAALA